MGTVSEDVWQEVFQFLQPGETAAPARTSKALNSASRHDGLWNVFAARAPPRLWLALRGTGRERFERAMTLERELDMNLQNLVEDEDIDCELTVVVTVTQAEEVVFLARFPYTPSRNDEGYEENMLSLRRSVESEHDIESFRPLGPDQVIPEVANEFAAAYTGGVNDRYAKQTPDFRITWMFERPDGRAAKLVTMEEVLDRDIHTQFCSSDLNDPYQIFHTYYERAFSCPAFYYNPWRLQIEFIVSLSRVDNPTGFVAEFALSAAHWTPEEAEKLERHRRGFVQGDSEMHADEEADISGRIDGAFPEFRSLLSRLRWI